MAQALFTELFKELVVKRIMMSSMDVVQAAAVMLLLVVWGTACDYGWPGLNGSDSAPVNQPPIVSAGPDQTITLPSDATLDGDVTDDGLPTLQTITTTWARVSGPGSVTFGDASAIDTTASFPTSGVYVLKLTAGDGVLSSSATVTIIVNPAFCLKVDHAAVAGGNGLTWQTAFQNPQDALAAAAAGDEIWCAAGTYKPTTGTDRTISFVLKAGVALYGGFAGSETACDQRNWTANVTTLCGDIGIVDDNGDNSYHVVVGANNATLDGFTVTGGNANGATDDQRNGGGMYNNSSSPTVTNCTFSGNVAVGGGGMCNKFSSPTVMNCTFIGNIAWIGGGGGMFNGNSSPAVTSCAFSGNMAIALGGGGIGGGMYNDSSSPTVTNCTFSGNETYHGGGMYNGSSSPVMRNCVFWGNKALDCPDINNDSSTTAFFYCDIAGCGGSGAGWNTVFGTDGGGNIAADPLFVDADGADNTYGTLDDNTRLQSGSQCVDAGNNTLVPTDSADLDKDRNTTEPVPYDLDCNQRFVDVIEIPDTGVGPAPIVDMGAYEVQRSLKVDHNAAAGGDGLTWDAAFQNPQDALAAAAAGDEIWCAAGTYKPTTGTDRTISFVLKAGVALYGGFVGTETERGQRNWTANVTTLCGDIGVADDNADNSYHVVIGADNAILDGFTVTGGNASVYPIQFGGGMYNESSSPTVTNCTFSGNEATNWGGGMYNKSSSPTVTNCTFSDNYAHDGGGMSNISSSPTVTNCTFSGNEAGHILGGGGPPGTGAGMCNRGSSPTVTNCTFSGNLALGDGAGGGMHNGGSSSPHVGNCIFWVNTAATGPEIFNNITTPIISYCDIAGCGGSGAGWNTVFGTDGGGNIAADPLFVDADGADNIYGTSDDNTRLQSGSPCIDAGNNTNVPNDSADLDNDDITTEPVPYDLDCRQRFVDVSEIPDTGVGQAPIVDMGAYEFQPEL